MSGIFCCDTKVSLLKTYYLIRTVQCGLSNIVQCILFLCFFMIVDYVFCF